MLDHLMLCGQAAFHLCSLLLMELDGIHLHFQNKRLKLTQPSE